MPVTSPPRAWAEIDLGAIRHNLNVVKQAAKWEYYMPVVKAGAYGHGLEQVCRTLDSEGIAFFGVANVGEARRISQAGCRTRPYILGPAFPEEREEIVLNGWRSFISTMEEAEHYNSLARLYGKTLPIHLSVDTGMGRGGFLPDQLEELLSRLGELAGARTILASTTSSMSVGELGHAAGRPGHASWGCLGGGFCTSGCAVKR